MSWYRVVGDGLNGAPKGNPEDAWDSFFRVAKRKLGYLDHEKKSAVKAHSARLIKGLTRKHVERAFFSDIGRCWFVDEEGG